MGGIAKKKSELKKREGEQEVAMKTKWVKIVNIKDDELQRGLMTLAFSECISVSLEKILEMERRMKQC